MTAEEQRLREEEERLAREEKERKEREERERLKALEEARFLEETNNLNKVLEGQREELDKWKEEQQHKIQVGTYMYMYLDTTCMYTCTCSLILSVVTAVIFF